MSSPSFVCGRLELLYTLNPKLYRTDQGSGRCSNMRVVRKGVGNETCADFLPKNNL